MKIGNREQGTPSQGKKDFHRNVRMRSHMTSHTQKSQKQAEALHRCRLA
ncbi:MAG: hypothetical protein AB1589_27590 [Cyanobacteriota bacterium]